MQVDAARVMALPDAAAGAILPKEQVVDLRVVGVAVLFLLSGTLFLWEAFGGRQASLFLVGGALGLVLYHAVFGFTSAWRLFLADRRGAGLRAQMLLLAVTSLLFLPALASGSLFGRPVGEAVAPLGVWVLVGASLFGVGMQLGGGCASGTLYTAGGGNTRMLVTLLFFIVGSVIGAAHFPWWAATPTFKPISLVKELGLAPAIGLQLTAFAIIAGATMVLERRRHGRLTAGSWTEYQDGADCCTGPGRSSGGLWPWRY